MDRLIPKLLWIDGSAAALAGSLCLLLSPALAQLHALPQNLLQLIGVVNLLYAAYSFCLAMRASRPRLLITLLVIANSVWAAVCLGMAASFAGTASIFGLAHLVGEAVFVAGLARLEWQWRERLLQAV
ncbi:hypothetical protein [Paucibacter sp. XJ19-41]|uniref:hypothetical protein n=1 Tax=Paucibacter sp. XJ19-41 TaxID=2927824 RepID=UPI00234B6F25|nr:hypothetical protein [Paucibacter sp. XJ19-41]MDC6170492.1 hypothetical protein [Paucibacter sp. XJ19-41]